MVNSRQVAITGLGALTPLGVTVHDTWQAILKGQSGVGEITRFDASALSTRICAGVKDFDPTLYLLPKESKRFDEFVIFAVAAAHMAIEDSGLIVTEEEAGRMGVAIGSGMGGLPYIEKSHSRLLEFGPARVSPFFIPGAIINMAPGLVSIKFGLKGPNTSTVTACTTGAHNIGIAMRMIQYGDADVMVAGGSEMATTELSIGGFSSAKALSRRNDEPEKASRPWDKDRDGFVLGEGAGILILQEYEHAKKRGAPIYAMLTGFGMSADAYHITMPSQDGAVLSMINAMKDAGLNAEQIQYVNAHGTSTPIGDIAEANAIKKAFGDHAYQLAVSSTKSMTGHLLGAAGAVEAVFSALALKNQVVPATINLDNPDEGCDLDFVPHTAREMEVQHVMSNSFGFGGTNGSLVLSRVT